MRPAAPGTIGDELAQAVHDHRRVLLLLPRRARRASASALRANAFSARCVPARASGCCQNASRLASTSVAGVARLRAFAGSSAYGRSSTPARSTSGRARSPCRASACRPSRRRSAGRRAAGPTRPSQAQAVVSIAAADPPKEAGGEDDRRLHHARPRVERRMQEDRRDDRPDCTAGDVERSSAARRRRVRRRRHEVAPELLTKNDGWRGA